MRNNRDENKAFITACEKAGLKVQSKESRQIAEGLVIVDARGNNYTVNTDGNINRIGGCFLGGLEVERRIARFTSPAKRVNRRRRLKGNRLERCGRASRKQEY